MARRARTPGIQGQAPAGRSPRRGLSTRLPAASEGASPARGSRGGALLRTAEVLRRTGITHQVLYRYVTLGLLEPAETTEGGTRLFRPEVVPLIRLIQSFNDSGYSLRDLKETFFTDKNVRRVLIERKPSKAL